jgi:exodeoxyribonuclease VIII
MNRIELNQPDADYRAAVGVNSSSLRHALRSLAHYRQAVDHPKPRTAAMTLGTALHALVLMPQQFGDLIAVMPPDAPTRQSKAGKDWHAEFAAAAAGKDVISFADFETVNAMAQAVAAHDIAAGLLEDCAHREASLYWTDETSGLPCKARADALSDDFRVLLDLKTSADAREEQFARSAFEYGYHTQAAHYVDGVLHACDVQPLYAWIVVENEPPHGVAVYSASPSLLNIGREDCDLALSLIAEATVSGKWPGYPVGIRPLTLPAWAVKARIRKASGIDYAT